MEVLIGAQLEEPAAGPLVEAGGHALRGTGEETSRHRLDDPQALVGEVPQEKVGAVGRLGQLRLQISGRVAEEGAPDECRGEDAQVQVADINADAKASCLAPRLLTREIFKLYSPIKFCF